MFPHNAFKGKTDYKKKKKKLEKNMFVPDTNARWLKIHIEYIVILKVTVQWNIFR